MFSLLAVKDRVKPPPKVQKFVPLKLSSLPVMDANAPGI